MNLLTPLGHRLSPSTFAALFLSKIKGHPHDGNYHLGNGLIGAFQFLSGGICSALQKSFHLYFSLSSNALLRVTFGIRFLDGLFTLSQ